MSAAPGAPAPPEEPDEALLLACEVYADARKEQLSYRRQHGGGDDPTLVSNTMRAYNALIVASPVSRGVAEASRGAPTPAMIDDLQHLEILLSQAGVDDGSSQFDHVITARYIKRALEMVAALRAALTAPEGQP